jgi:predicted hotdog family 3-hydroxylacyl-ACP dehydratase
MLSREEIECRVPHAGTMCLLRAVSTWDATRICCVADAPDAMHPLASAGIVPAVGAAEFAAQAVAVHGALLDGQRVPRSGRLGKLSEVDLHAACIPADEGPLTVQAELFSRGPAGCIYTFEVATTSRLIANGRLMVAFAPPG